jgi:uncharacterized protein HemX
VKNKGELASPSPAKAWTTPQDYLCAMARRRTARRQREPSEPRTQPEAPYFSLSTLPFLVLMAVLMVITVGIAVAAWPGGLSQQLQTEQRLAAGETGTASKGWFQEAQKEMQR